MSPAFAGRAAGKHPLSVFVSRRTKVTGIFLPPSHMCLQHGCPPKRKPVSLLLGFRFLHPPHPVPPASTQTGRSGPTFQVTRFPRREGRGPLGRQPRDLTCHPGKAPLFLKTREGRARSAVLNLNLKHSEFLKGCLPPTPTASTLIITSEKARPAVGFSGVNRAARQRQRGLRRRRPSGCPRSCGTSLDAEAARGEGRAALAGARAAGLGLEPRASVTSPALPSLACP